MWSSSVANNNNNSKRVSCSSPSKSSSFSPSSSPTTTTTTPSSTTTTPHKKSMEEVWKDINLSSLHDHFPTSTAASAGQPTTTFQEFLATRPLNKENPPPTSTSTSTSRSAEPELPSSCATILSLNSGADFNFLENNCSNDLVRPDPQVYNNNGGCGGGGATTTTPSFLSSLNSPFDALPPSSVFPPFCHKRALPENDDNPSDRRYKRMMKNRESAARSRARRQAYTNELELEVANLMEENARLKRQQEKLLVAAPPAQLPKKNTLSRTSTAPF